MAKGLVPFSQKEALLDILSDTFIQNENLLVLGGGSNVLFTKDFDGIILKNELEGIEIVEENESHVYIKVGAGVIWHEFVMYCVQHQFAGVENLALIPGCVGASPMQNIGAYGVELKDVFHSLEAIHIKDKNMVSLSNAECKFGYRESIFKNEFKNQFIIINVTFKLNKKAKFHIEYGAIKQELENKNISELSLQSVADAVINIRKSKLPDPSVLGNAGSFFKNPEVTEARFLELKKEFTQIVGYPTSHDGYKIAAGWMIEFCGWKGFRKNDVGCHDKQALVLVNYGQATGKEIFDLSEEIIQDVYQTFQIKLTREVNVY
jgi:UDP-N-acetylmuramate dehydrogenase